MVLDHVRLVEAYQPGPSIDTNRNDRVQRTYPLMIKLKYLISIKIQPQPCTEKPHPLPFNLLCCLLRVYSKYSNRAVTLIQQSCISNTLTEQSPHSIITKN